MKSRTINKYVMTQKLQIVQITLACTPLLNDTTVVFLTQLGKRDHLFGEHKTS